MDTMADYTVHEVKISISDILKMKCAIADGERAIAALKQIKKMSSNPQIDLVVEHAINGIDNDSVFAFGKKIVIKAS